MRKSLTAFLTALIVVVSSGLAFGEKAPVSLTHTLTGYSNEGTGVNLSYTMHVVNRGDKTLSNLTLTVVPSRNFASRTTILKVDSLAPDQTADLTFDLQSRLPIPKEQVLRQPLFIAAKCFDQDGNLVEFPAKSRPGGAR